VDSPGRRCRGHRRALEGGNKKPPGAAIPIEMANGDGGEKKRDFMDEIRQTMP
jgi:hypothetical protein